MKKLISIISLVTFVISQPALAKKCRKGIDCNLPTTAKSYPGKKRVTGLIKVTLCHGYWSRLSAGNVTNKKTSRTTLSQWWKPRLRYKNGILDKDPVRTAMTECFEQHVPVNSCAQLKSKCVDGIISTRRITGPGTYYLKKITSHPKECFPSRPTS